MNLVILALIGFFVLSLLLRTVLPNLCAICASVSATWIVLLGGNIVFGLNAPMLVLGILMGGSAVGLMYYIFAKIPSEYAIWKFPFLLSSFYIVYLATSTDYAPADILLVAAVWLTFGFIFLLRNTAAQSLVKKLIECCKNW